MTDKITVADKTVRSFTNFEDWKTAVSATGHKVVVTRDKEDETEFFAEKMDDDDPTMIGYFKDDWGMIV